MEAWVPSSAVHDGPFKIILTKYTYCTLSKAQYPVVKRYICGLKGTINSKVRFKFI